MRIRQRKIDYRIRNTERYESVRWLVAPVVLDHQLRILREAVLWTYPVPLLSIQSP